MIRLCAGVTLRQLRTAPASRPIHRWASHNTCLPAESAARTLRSPLCATRTLQPQLLRPSARRARWFSSSSGDPYATLGVGRGASADEIKRAYFRVAKKTHPDIDKSPGAAARFRAAAEAFEVLRDPARRRAYDAGGMAGAQQQQQRQQQQQQAHDHAREQQRQGDGFGAWEREQMRSAEDVFQRVWAELGFDEIDAYIAQARLGHGPHPAQSRRPHRLGRCSTSSSMRPTSRWERAGGPRTSGPRATSPASTKRSSLESSFPPPSCSECPPRCALICSCPASRAPGASTTTRPLAQGLFAVRFISIPLVLARLMPPQVRMGIIIPIYRLQWLLLSRLWVRAIKALERAATAAAAGARGDYSAGGGGTRDGRPPGGGTQRRRFNQRKR